MQRLTGGLSTAQEAIAKMKFLVRSRFENPRSAFAKFDRSHTRTVKMTDIRAILEEECNLSMSDPEFASFCVAVAGSAKAIDFDQFVAAFDAKDSIEGHGWLKSDHKYVMLSCSQ